jgi:hypothetical protein
MCDMVTLGGKDNGLELKKPHIFDVQCAWPLDLKINKKYPPPIGTLYVWFGDSRW